MSSTGPVPPPPRTVPPRRTVPPARRRLLVAGAAGVSLLLVVVAGYLVLRRGGDDQAPLVLDRPDTVVWGRTVDRPVEVAADRVTLRRVVVRAGGPAAVRIRPGVTGTVIEDTEIRCAGPGTDGVVPGNYTARRVATFGCREPFRSSAGAPAEVVDSSRDGQRYDPGPVGVPSTGPSDLVAPAPPGTPATPAAPTAPAAALPPTPLSYWPGPGTTGVPAGTTLRPSGSLTLRTDGQVVSGLDIAGCVNVYARNVRILRSRITCTSPTFAIRTFDTVRNLLVEDVEINGVGRTATAVCCANYTLHRVNIHNAIDGPRLGNFSYVLDSWIHDLSRVTGSHNDTLQTTGGSTVAVRHNRLEPYNVPLDDPMNACLMVGSTTAPSVTNLLMTDNYCNGGNYSIGVRTDLVASNVRFTSNKFGRDYRYGVIARPTQAGIVWDKASNVWFDNGQPVVR
jgi:hypothetical protein